jgi:hypothetical protein
MKRRFSVKSVSRDTIITINGQVRMNRRAGFEPNWLKIARRPRNGPKAKTFNAAEKFCIMRAAQ